MSQASPSPDAFPSAPKVNVAANSVNDAPRTDCAPGEGCCGPSPAMERREFLKFVGGTSLAAFFLPRLPIAGPFTRQDATDHFVPADKKLSPEWLRALTAPHAPEEYTGKDLETIGMPIGGIAAGTVYLTGDGRLVQWDVMNSKRNSGWGAVSYKVGRKPDEVVKDNAFVEIPPLDQGFTIQIKGGGVAGDEIALDARGFRDIRFRGTYPIAKVGYRRSDLPVQVDLEAMSPFCPPDADDSALPLTILIYTVKNTSDAPIEIFLRGRLENRILRETEAELGTAGFLRKTNVTSSEDEGRAVGVLLKAVPAAIDGADSERPPIVFADFEGDDYAGWTIEGEAFGKGPAAGTLKGQNPVTGFDGKKLVNTFIDGDRPVGRAISPEFPIERDYITFKIGGGADKDKTCVRLHIDGVEVKSATGRQSEQLAIVNWSVAEWRGKKARIEIVDAASGPWGHVNVDQIEFRDRPRHEPTLEHRADFGTMALACLCDETDRSRASAGTAFAERPDERIFGTVRMHAKLPPGEEKTFRFAVAWHFPNGYYAGRRVGQRYARRFGSADDVIQYAYMNRDRLIAATRLWRDTYYDSTLPPWLLDRLHSTAANLATATCEWWRNGRFWAWEGAGCCHGTCGHVWNYAQTAARLFPALERSVREMQDFVPGIGFDEKTGAIGFRGEGWKLWAGDSQPGYVLKAYREHLMSETDEFLERLWPRVKKALEFLVAEDKNDDGLIEGRQHQTYDENYFGANTFTGALYLAALRAGAEMASITGDFDFAARCRALAEKGSDETMKRLFNGEYFIQDVDLGKHPDAQYKDGCLADQLFGQFWADELGLGSLYPKEAVKKALQSIWKYCWAPDVGPQNRAHDPERWFAYPSEAGLFTCTWPKSKHLGPKSTRYRDEVWTGIEYQVAAAMISAGLVKEGLAICRAIHERYHPSKRNPWNEVECGDHYARAMASWGVLRALGGFEYDGPRGRVAFAPMLTPENFKTSFTFADGFGTYEQSLTASQRTFRIRVRSGRLKLSELRLRDVRGSFEKTRLKVAGRETRAFEPLMFGIMLTPMVILGPGDEIELITVTE